ncbi:MAG: c-type cytochrome [Gemmataceae bacterium]
MSTEQSQQPTPGPKPRNTPDTREAHDIYDLHAPILRERSEPKDGYEPIPLWLTIVYGIILFFGGYYMATYNGGWRADVYDETKGGIGGTVAAEPADPMELAGEIYTINCASCHQQTGLGQAGQFPPLAGSEWVAKDHEVLGRIILHGLAGPIEVKGETYTSAMSHFKRLSNEDIALVLTYIRSQWGNDYDKITKEQIESVRKATEDRETPWTAQELIKIEEEIASRPPPKKVTPEAKKKPDDTPGKDKSK